VAGVYNRWGYLDEKREALEKRATHLSRIQHIMPQRRD
jgi:hypothetical protein